MTTFIFTGDMLVMLFMILVVVWVSIHASDETLEYSARIPLMDEKGSEFKENGNQAESGLETRGGK